ncbi:MAG: TIGR02147 family protein [Bdellovibrionota bacterium]
MLTTQSQSNEKEILPASAAKPSLAVKGPDSVVLETLRFEFTRRVQKNPQYSMRSFAKHIGVSHTLLSLVLNGHRKPSRAMVEQLAERLQYSPSKTAFLLGEQEKQKRTPARVAKDPTHQEKISLDQFALISEWQHYAILSLLQVPDTEFEPKFIAKRLGISPLLAKVSMQRLVSLEIVFQDASGRWKQKSGPIVVENTKSTESTRKFQRQLLAKAVDSMVNDPMEQRDLSSTTFAMDPKQIPYAVKRIREFRRQLTDELEAFGNPDEVYNLTVQLFPSSKRTKK